MDDVLGLGITSVKIDAPVIVTASRNTTLDFSVLLNGGGRSDAYIVWTISDPSFATVDNNGNVAILNKMGMATLTARDSVGGLTHSIVLRIT
jgi:hypothetical protein